MWNQLSMIRLQLGGERRWRKGNAPSPPVTAHAQSILPQMLPGSRIYCELKRSSFFHISYKQTQDVPQPLGSTWLLPGLWSPRSFVIREGTAAGEPPVFEWFCLHPPTGWLEGDGKHAPCAQSTQGSALCSGRHRRPAVSPEDAQPARTEGCFCSGALLWAFYCTSRHHPRSHCHAVVKVGRLRLCGELPRATGQQVMRSWKGTSFFLLSEHPTGQGHSSDTQHPAERKGVEDSGHS